LLWILGSGVQFGAALQIEGPWGEDRRADLTT